MALRRGRLEKLQYRSYILREWFSWFAPSASTTARPCIPERFRPTARKFFRSAHDYVGSCPRHRSDEDCERAASLHHHWTLAHLFVLSLIGLMRGLLNWSTRAKSAYGAMRSIFELVVVSCASRKRLHWQYLSTTHARSKVELVIYECSGVSWLMTHGVFGWLVERHRSWNHGSIMRITSVFDVCLCYS